MIPWGAVNDYLTLTSLNYANGVPNILDGMACFGRLTKKPALRKAGFGLMEVCLVINAIATTAMQIQRGNKMIPPVVQNFRA